MSTRAALAAALLLLLAGSTLAGAVEERHAQARRALRAHDYAGAATLWRSLARQDDAEAFYRLGVLARAGRGMPRSDERAFRWMRRAARKGHAKACYELSLLYREGRGTRRDPEAADRWLRAAAAAGHARARVELARREGAGSRPGQDIPASAQQALRRALAQEDRKALEEALARGARLEARDARGRTPLMAACARGALPAARLLLEAGANPNTRDADGTAALHLAL